MLIPKEQISPLVPAVPTPSMNIKKELDGILETTAEGNPQLVIDSSDLSAKDVIGLLLYWSWPNGFTVRKLTELVNKSWKTTKEKYIASVIAGAMKGLVLKEGQKGSYVFKLSGAGKSWVETELIPEIKNSKK